ncbi:hypothetical protein FA13DRAFT_491877 [Coprinellus micaceus]|uniref:Uncharacterized protein n=1 Tax=Coprinellus micaceus TaxID=71717 RepID=A0A4Y7T9W7_COPMI|nr:hypothetical protein FA13DRAFT_491877 [Coprinellus micaceus]
MLCLPVWNDSVCIFTTVCLLCFLEYLPFSPSWIALLIHTVLHWRRTENTLHFNARRHVDSGSGHHPITRREVIRVQAPVSPQPGSSSRSPLLTNVLSARSCIECTFPVTKYTMLYILFSPIRASSRGEG